MLILLKKDKIVSCIITIGIIVGLLVFANANKEDNSVVQTSTNIADNMVNNVMNTLTDE